MTFVVLSYRRVTVIFFHYFVIFSPPLSIYAFNNVLRIPVRYMLYIILSIIRGYVKSVDRRMYYL